MELATINQNPYKLALVSPKILEMKKGEATKELIDLLSKTYYEAGQVAPGFNVQEQGKNLQQLGNSLYDEVKLSFSFLRMDELRLAFRNGVRKEYGDFFGLNISTFHAWIKAYQFDNKRREALQKLKEESHKPVAPLLTPEEAEQEWKAAMLRQFEEFKKTGVLNCPFPAHQFKEFKQRGLIRLNSTEYEMVFEQAKDAVAELHKVKRLSPKSIKERDRSTKRINEIESGKMTEETESEVKNHARTLAIENYYRGIERLEI